MAGAIGADSLMFLSTNDFKTVLEGIGVQWCDACFTGVYPIQESSIDRAELL